MSRAKKARPDDKLPVRELLTCGESISPETRVSEVAARFHSEKVLDALPLVHEGRACGLASRSKILTTLAIRFGFALYGKKPISAIADMQPLIVHQDETLDGVLGKAMARDYRDIYDEILVVDDAERYLGRLSVKRLVIEQGNHLAQNIAQRELAVARAAEIEKLNQMKSSFMAHVTHELRSPVHAIVGLAELMEICFSQQRLDDYPKYLSLLSTSAQNLRSIINNILDLSKIEAGRMELVNEEFSLCELLSEVTETCKVLIAEKPIMLEVDCSETGAALVADRVKVRQILLNLVSNAVKYTDRGIIVISAEVDDALHLSVKDTGIGIRQEDLERLFQAFSQLEDAKTRRREGTGLGLTITQELVHLLGGHIRVESTFGVGSRFDVQIPCKINLSIKEAS